MVGGEIFSSYNITKQMREQEFSLQNASYVFKLKFALNDTQLLKDYLQKVHVVKITASNLILLSKNSIGAFSCKRWEFSFEFDFKSLDKVKQKFSRNYRECKSDNFDSDDESKETGADSIIFQEFFIYNAISFTINFSMTIFILSVVIEIFKYRSLKAEKRSKYRWLLRNKKNFDGAVRQI